MLPIQANEETRYADTDSILYVQEVLTLFYIVTYYIKWIKTYCTNSIHTGCEMFFWLRAGNF